MRQSPRRPLIFKGRKLSFQHNDQQTTDSLNQSGASVSKDPPKSASNQCFPDGICLWVILPCLLAKDTERGVQGPRVRAAVVTAKVSDISMRSTAGQPAQGETLNNFPDVKPEVAEGPLNDSLSDIQWLADMSTSSFEPDPPTPVVNKENPNCNSQILQGVLKQPGSQRPPYSYMAMIQFAINSRRNRRMVLKDIYTWIEDHFPYFRDVAKKGWKNSVRHNLSLHDMFVRETSPDGKVSFWTIRPEVNRFLTLDQVYKQQKSMVPDSKKTPTGSDKKIRIEGKEEPISVQVKCETSKAPSKRAASSSGCKQHLVHSLHEEPLLLCPSNSFSDSGVASDASAFRDMHNAELDRRERPGPEHEFSFKTPIKSSSHLTSSTPSKPPSNILPELWKVTPVGKGSQSVLDFSPIHTPSGPTVSPRRHYTTLSFSSTPFKDLPLFNSPKELLTSTPCTELSLDMNESFMKMFMDQSFSGLVEDVDIANISCSEFIAQL
uniref:Forkhead box protein M1 n=1 Tax=Sphaeramia orbicularis TaxID=375764 RepID=A0A673BII6_9TELE